MTFNQGQWVRFSLGESPRRVLPDATTAGVRSADLPPLYAHGGTCIGVWYPAGKKFAGLAAPAPCPTVWPVDPAHGMPLVFSGAALCLDADALGAVGPCVLADVPEPRRRSMTPDEVRRFVEGVA